jgi:RNA polymerase sigma-70 factor (ECF subfamily)
MPETVGSGTTVTGGSAGAGGGRRTDTHFDHASQRWVESLRARSPGRDEAIARLHALLLRAARFELTRRGAQPAHLRGDSVEDLATQCADDALVALLAKLDEYRGDSRFTTWAYKFALLEAAVKLRRRAWQGREIPVENEGLARFGGDQAGADDPAERAEQLHELGEAMQACLTPHQREVLVALTLNGVPIDVLAERLNTTRGALYKSLYDARRKLRAALALDELPTDPPTGG